MKNGHCTPECESGWVICPTCVADKLRLLREMGKLRRAPEPPNQGELPGLVGEWSRQSGSN